MILLSCTASAQGKKVFVGTGSGFIDYPNAQATLNLQDGDTVVINPGKYKLMNFRNIAANPGHKIYITNGGLVEFNDPSPSTFSNLSNVEIRGDGVPGIPFGFYMHDLIRAISIDGSMSGVYFSYIKMVNIKDYGVFFYNPLLQYNGTNSNTSLFYDIKFLHFSVSNIMTSFLQLGLFGRVMDDGPVSMFRKLEVAYCTVDYTDQQDVFHLSKVLEANIHHNRLSHLGTNDFRHTGIIYLYGSGAVHHNYITDYWGSGLRAHSFSLDTVGAVNIYNNVMVNSRKYSGIEVQCTPEDIAYSSYMRYCNFKVYNNTFGNLSAADWQAAMIDSYNAVGGSIEIKNNLGFNIQRDKPYDPARNYVYTQLNITKPDTAGNRYFTTSAAAGLADDSSCLLNINSPAIDKGVSLPLVQDDIDGITRPQSGAYDIGAHEYLTGIVYPVSMAGADTSTLLPKDSIVLSGSSSYNPTGGVLTYKWSQVAGPATAIFVNDTMAKPLVKNLIQGSYQLKLAVTNAQGHSSEDMLVLVVSPVPVFPPVANAGGNITITLPINSTALSAAASTNSAGGVLRYTWIKIAGPASFSISGDTTVSPFISSLTEGSYQIRLTVTNSNGLSASDTATVTVQPAPIPVANAGEDKHIVLPVNTVVLDGSASATAGGGTLGYVWTKVSGPASFSITGDSSATPSLGNLTEGIYQLKLTVTNNTGNTGSDFINITVAAAPVAIANAGADINIVLPTSAALLNGTGSYSTGGGALIYGWSLIAGATNASLGGASTATPSLSNLEAGIYQVRLKITDQQGLTAADTVTVTVSAQPVYPPVSYAGTDIVVRLPANSVILNGDQSFNPAGGALTYAWTFISGPASFSIAGAGSATPTISNLVEGAYLLRLVVTNQQGLSSQDEVTVTVSPAPPMPPAANAGNDITVTLPVNAVNLDGSGSSNAAGGALIYNWLQVSGPSLFTINGPATTAPAVNNLIQGVYQVKLIVTNAQGLSAEDIVSITVLPAAVPVARAGKPVTLVLPANTVTLNGSGSSDPAGGSLTYSWAKVEGPAAFTLSGNATATPVLSNLGVGVYRVQLTVTNTSGNSATDIVTVTVNLPALPVAAAGNDTTISFPGGNAVLNGTSSSGADGVGISNYHWLQIAGPTTAVITDSEADKTSTANLEPGVYIFQLTITDDYGQKASATVKITVQKTVAYLRSISVYPNPCVNLLHVRAASDSTGSLLLRITSLSGTVLRQQTHQKNQLIFDEAVSVAGLPAGMYLLEIIIKGNAPFQSKFIKL